MHSSFFFLNGTEAVTRFIENKRTLGRPGSLAGVSTSYMKDLPMLDYQPLFWEISPH